MTLKQSQSEEMATNITADLIVCATGFENTLHKSLIHPLAPECSHDDVVVRDDFSVQFRSPESPDVFIINHSQAQHGPTEHTLAGISERGKVIGDALIRNMHDYERKPASKGNDVLTGALNNKESKIVTH